MFLEVIATSLKDIENINKSQADQIELCKSMEFGGYTPRYELIAQACRLSEKPVMVMVRHNNDSFEVDDKNFEQFKKDIDFIKTTHAAGIVCGVLIKNNNVDINTMEKIIKLAKPLHVTFHRAFDGLNDQSKILQELVDLGITTVLTSGGIGEITNNIANFKILKKLKLPVRILAGGGINMENLPLFVENGITDIHVGKCVRKDNSFENPIDPNLIDKIKQMISK